jgi:hypothetical protein
MNALLDLIRRWFAPRPEPIPLPVRIYPSRPTRSKQP